MDSSPPLSGDENSEMNPSVTHFDLDEDVSKATGVEYFFASDARCVCVCVCVFMYEHVLSTVCTFSHTQLKAIIRTYIHMYIFTCEYMYVQHTLYPG